MKKFYYNPILLLSLFIISCGSSKIFINPDYKEKRINNAILAIAPLKDLSIVENMTLANDLNFTKSDDSVKTFFNEIFMYHLKNKSNFNNVYMVEYNKNLEFQDREFQLNDDTFMFNLPTKEIEFKTEEEVYLLFIDHVSFVFQQKERDPSSPGKNFTVSGLSEKDAKFNSLMVYDYYINLNITYCIVDNSSLNVISYGKLKDEKKYVFLKSVDKIMEQEISEITMRILEETPFEKK